MLNAVLKRFSLGTKPLILILVGSLSWCLTMVKSGWIYAYGMGFWGANGHDGIWHIALAESLSQGSFKVPVFAGSVLQNYHLGFDLLLALLHKITFVPIINLYFQVLPVVFSLLIGLLSYIFVLKMTKNEGSAMWSVFFVYFAGSFGWIIGQGESAFWSQQAISTLINPPYSLSLILILLGLILLQGKKLIASILFFGILIQVKVYAGVLVIGALFLAGIYDWLTKKNALYIKVFLGTFLLSITLFLLLNRGSQNLLVFKPLWFLETLMGLTDRLNWQRYYSAMLAYRSGNNLIKFVPAYGAALVIFLIGNFGTRTVMFLRKIEYNAINIFVYSVITGGVLAPMIFLQKGTPWNTIQFFYYSLFFTSILAGIGVSGIKNKLLLLIIVLMTIPTSIISLKDIYIPSRPPAMISKNELSALSFLTEEPPGIVLTKPFDKFEAKAAEEHPPRPLYLYVSTAYVSALSKHQTFLEDEVNLDITGFNWQERRDRVVGWYNEKDYPIARLFLTDNNIKYVYWIKAGQSLPDLGKLGVVNIYENDLITIYRVE